MLLDNKPLKIIQPYPGQMDSVNALKFICAIMVVGIHVHSIVSEYLIHIFRIAVPIFLFISGYFLVSNDGTLKLHRVTAVMRKILVLIVTANCVYILFNLLLSIHRLDYPLIPTLLEGNTICYALWYLTAYLECLILIAVFIKLEWTKILPYLAIVGYILGLFCGSYSWLIGNNMPEFIYFNWKFNLYRNFFTVCLPCVIIGVLLRQHESKIIKGSESVYIGIVIALILLLSIEYCLLGEAYRNTDILFFTIPLALCVYMLTIKSSNKSLIISKLGQKYASGIYLYHLLFLQIIYILISKGNIYAILGRTSGKYWIYPLLVGVCIAILWLFDRFKLYVINRFRS